jgi:serine/threonine protein phosphatase 1
MDPQRMADQHKFAVFRRTQRVWAVAAIHGEDKRLGALHAELGDRIEDGDRLVYLGNFMGRGDGVRAVVDELLSFRATFLARPRAHVCDIAFLRGSQEEMWQKLLQLQMAPNPREVLPWLLGHGVGATVTAYGGIIGHGEAAVRGAVSTITRWTGVLREAMNAAPGHAALMSALRHAAYSDDGNLLFVNCGLDRARPLPAQGDSFWWGGGGFQDVDKPFEGYRRIVRGYDPSHGGIKLGKVCATIDGGCGFDGPLVAACFATNGDQVDRIEA